VDPKKASSLTLKCKRELKAITDVDPLYTQKIKNGSEIFVLYHVGGGQ